MASWAATASMVEMALMQPRSERFPRSFIHTHDLRLACWNRHLHVQALGVPSLKPHWLKYLFPSAGVLRRGSGAPTRRVEKSASAPVPAQCRRQRVARDILASFSFRQLGYCDADREPQRGDLRSLLALLYPLSVAGNELHDGHASATRSTCVAP